MHRKKARGFRITRITKKFDAQRRRYTFNIQFETTVTPTERTIAVAEAFGLGVDEEKLFTVYDHFVLEFGPGDVVYIVGDSGSGKSVLMRELRRALDGEAVDMNEVDAEVDPDVPIVETVGGSVGEAVRLLSSVGLGDAFTLLRPYKQLSDGQKYRYRLAKLLESNSEYWMCDEFCSLLDRDTARVVAYNVQKLARRLGKCLVVATCHRDLLEDLNPSVYVEKGLGSDVKVHYRENKPTEKCSLLKEIRIEPGEFSDFMKLSRFHYRGAKRFPTLHVYRAVRKSAVVGVIVYSPPPIQCWGRRHAFRRSPTLKELNEHFANISRVVVHPKYRMIGLGVKLVRETLPLVGRAYVETSAVMARYNPFFEKAGMKRVAVKEPNPDLTKAIQKLEELGFHRALMASKAYNRRMLKELEARGLLGEVRDALRVVRNIPIFRTLVRATYPRVRDWCEALDGATVEELAKVLAKVASTIQVKVYLLWRNPALECPMDELLKVKFQGEAD